jgi:Sec-independent protein translocase protein TatA
VFWWILLAIVVLAVLVLAAAAVSTLARLRELAHVVTRLRRSAEQAKQLREPIGALQQRVEGLQAKVAATQRRRQARREAAEPSR